mmetsp:Transcript_39045/g.59484  ORF Transcript_39045/g.59484 Transcript_39045/m.59484 type:complete len:82 (+) Transcript_39045:42-287(+)
MAQQAHIVKNPIFKLFMDKKSELKPTFQTILKQFQALPPVLPTEEKFERLFEYADSLQDYFPEITVVKPHRTLDSPASKDN